MKSLNKKQYNHYFQRMIVSLEQTKPLSQNLKISILLTTVLIVVKWKKQIILIEWVVNLVIEVYALMIKDKINKAQLDHKFMENL